MERSATAEARAGDFFYSRHVTVELAIGYGLGDRKNGRAGIRIEVRRNSFAPNLKGGEPIYEHGDDSFGEWLDPRDLEPFALALMEAVRLAKLDGVIQPWMVGDEPSNSGAAS